MAKLSDRLAQLEALTQSDAERVSRIELVDPTTGEICHTIELPATPQSRPTTVRLPQKNNG